MANSRTGKPLNSYYKDGKRQNLLQIAFLELDKYNKDKHITDEGRQWLEFFGNLPFSKEPSQAVTHADSLCINRGLLIRQQGQTHKMYEQMEPVYGIAILEKTLLPDEESPINTYWMANSRTGKPLNSYYKDGKRQNLLQIAFLELDKYNKDKHITDEGRQWLEFFGNLPFSKEPSQAVTHADSLLDSSSWTQEEKAMIDEHIRIQENYDMTMETAIDEAREEGLEQGLEQGLERGLKQGLERGRYEGQLELIRKMLSKGLSLEVVSDVTGLSVEELETLLS